MVVRLVVKDERDSSLPGRLNGHVVDALLGGGVVPQGQVRVAIGVIRRWLDLEIAKYLELANSGFWLHEKSPSKKKSS